MALDTLHGDNRAEPKSIAFATSDAGGQPVWPVTDTSAKRTRVVKNSDIGRTIGSG